MNFWIFVILNGDELLLLLTSLLDKGMSRNNELIIPPNKGEELLVDVDASAILFDNARDNDTDNKEEVTVIVISNVMLVITS